LNGQSYTFLPKLGAIYTGNVEDGDIGFDNEYLASFDPVETPVEFRGSNKADSEFLANALQGVSKTHYKLTDIKAELSAGKKIEWYYSKSSWCIGLCVCKGEPVG